LSDSYIQHNGFNTVSFKLENYNALQIRCDNNCFSTSTYKGIEFYAKNSAWTQNLRVRLRSWDGEVGNNVIKGLTTDWQKFTVYFSELAPGISGFNVIQFQDDGNYSPNYAYFDEIYLIPNNC